MEKKIYNAPHAEVMFEITVKSNLFSGSGSKPTSLNVNGSIGVTSGLAKGGGVDMGW